MGEIDTSADNETFRQQLREAFAAANPGKPGASAEERRQWVREYHGKLMDMRANGPSWPREYGGMDLPFEKQVIYAEESAKARVPGQLGTGYSICGPTIIKYATSDQKERWLPALLSSREAWAQGFSEPEAGSDLPNLKTSAVRDGDYYIVNGQKLWSSNGHSADRLFTLVRTGTPGPDQPKHWGISYLIIDANTPGITVRPIKEMTGGTDFAEIFFTDVRVPITDRIGDEHLGWGLVRTSLGHERAAGTLNTALNYRRVVTEVLQLAKDLGVTGDPLIRQQLADFEARVRILYVSGARTIADITSKGEPGPASSVSRLFVTSFEQDLHEFVVNMLGAHGMLARKDPHSIEKGRWVWGFLRTRASTIGAGTAEIQKNTVGERVLGLPHEPSVK